MFPTNLTIPFGNTKPLPEIFAKDDVRYSEKLVEYFLLKYSSPGDLVFDPFVGYGTTLSVAKRFNRNAIGTEIDQNKINFLSEEFELNKEIFLDDVQDFVNKSECPNFDFLMTSPPYMSIGEKLNPFSDYTEEGDYRAYLNNIKGIFEGIKQKMKPNSYLVIEVSNLKYNGIVTTLAWDIGNVLSKIFLFKGEVIINWESETKENGNYGYGYDHSYCLVFLRS
ncbi:MAG: Modification methylase MboII [Candidatus Heimdallarchaeota archaeon LC_2]|nr:MAG: Modification methylase MboII [Candidatus Heimdallarchaeota archaeon LC_2]